MSILATAGRAKIYNTDGTGRDTYVSTNNGGFSIPNQAAVQSKGGSFGAQPYRRSFMYGGSPSPAKPIHYPTNGTGRDTYIYQNDGGLSNSFVNRNQKDIYISSLRAYPQSNHDKMRSALNQSSSKRNLNGGTKRDYFVEG